MMNQRKKAKTAPRKTTTTRQRDLHISTDEVFRREARIDRASISEESRTAEFSFSSDAPVERAFGSEILDHDPKSVRLGRLADGGPVLLGHDPDMHVGVVERVWLDGNKGRVLARFSRSSLGTDVFRDIVDGIRRNVSVGYRVHAAVAEGDKRAKDATYRVTDWEPFEVSMVSVPADVSVGVGRSVTPAKEVIPMSEDNTHEVEETRTAPVAAPIEDQIRVIEEEAAKKERQRQNEINAIADKHSGIKTLQIARQAALAGETSVEDFQRTALDLIGKANLSLPTELGMTPREVQRYSLVRMLDAQVQAQTGMDPMKVAPFEWRCHLDQLEKIGKRADKVKGWLIPHDVQSSFFRLPPADTTENASLVPEDHLADQFILAIRDRAAVMQAGATSLTGLVGDVSIPREEAVPVEWLAEDDDATDQDYQTSSVTMTPTTVASAVPITRRLLKQSSPDVDVVVRNNLVTGIALEIDKQALQGTGAGALPTGVRNSSPLTQKITTGAIAWDEAVGFESTVEAAGQSLLGNAAYIVHPVMKGLMKSTSKDSPGSGMFIWDGNMVNGYPAYSSTHAGATDDGIVFGTYSNLLIGFWGILDVMTDVYTRAKSGGVVVRVFQDVDVAVRRGSAFCIEDITP